MWQERAPAKVNLSLHVVGRRADGYHLLESLVVFADLADDLTLDSAQAFDLTIMADGATVPAGDDNLVLRAARALDERVTLRAKGRFHLTKRVPVAAGLGGGSADAAAALRLLARANGLALDHPALVEAARAAGADVPVCLHGRPALMTGIGDSVAPLVAWPDLHGVLVNPRLPCETAAVFRALDRRENPAHPPLPRVPDVETALAVLGGLRNDLEAPAIGLVPEIARALAWLRSDGAALARMSGSGATVFGLTRTAAEARALAVATAAAFPHWFAAPVRFAGTMP